MGRLFALAEEDGRAALHRFAGEMDDAAMVDLIRNLLVAKMQQLDELQFEALIRPAFEQDEWILITVGALLGFTMGEAQALILEHYASR